MKSFEVTYTMVMQRDRRITTRATRPETLLQLAIDYPGFDVDLDCCIKIVIDDVLGNESISFSREEIEKAVKKSRRSKP